MQNTAESLQYKRGKWYFKAFRKRPDYYVATANAVGFPDTLMDFLQHHIWFHTGSSALGACENLERKMGMIC